MAEQNKNEKDEKDEKDEKKKLSSKTKFVFTTAICAEKNCAKCGYSCY